MTDKERIYELRDKVLSGNDLTEAEAYELAETTNSAALRDAAAQITAQCAPRDFDFCSIVNARSGRCSENCKWCAQSMFHHTSCEEYDMVDHDECMNLARHNASKGVKRYSLVASGRKVGGSALDRICGLLREVRDNVDIETCASLGLLNGDDMRKLRAAGVRRYHCNLETAPSYFPSLCTTHTIEEKMATIHAAHEAGLEVCSGGIIGMGESKRQRVEFALKLREAQPVSIPINVLNPIPGTPLQDTPLISEDDIIDTVAIFRFIHPRIQLRFAGGRKRLSRESQLEAIRAGINGGITGDLLTTVGSTIDTDKQLVADSRAGH